MSDIIDELSWRGLIAQSTDPDELRKALDTGQVTFYAGFDPTAPGLHIGHLALMPREFYQFWRNRPDAEVPGMLRMFTFRSRVKIGALDEAMRDRPAAGEGQQALAEDVTMLVHGAK